VITSSPAVLERARATVTPALAAAVSRLAPVVRRPAEYHLGLTDTEGRPINAGGKHVRAALCLLASSASGGQETDALPAAVAIELVHNFSLVHDDIIDCDRDRRHRPTVWALFGVGPAIVTGDALNLLGMQVLLDAANPHGARAARALLEATARMIAGEGDDIAFETAPDVTLDDCLAMTEAKTGALLGCACAMGAILAGAPDAVVERLTAFGVHLGMAFQAVDDLLGIWGDPAVTGKPVFSDLRQHKKSIPIIAALTNANGDHDELHALLESARHSEDAARGAGALIEALGGRVATVRLADEHFDAAMAALAEAHPFEPAASELAALARFVVDRDR
jgi:geranylgeranyl diphosphate synthase, type I